MIEMKQVDKHNLPKMEVVATNGEHFISGELSYDEVWHSVICLNTATGYFMTDVTHYRELYDFSMEG